MVETIAGVALAAACGALGTVLTAGVHVFTRVAVIESKQASFEKWLQNVEAKLDRVIEGRV